MVTCTPLYVDCFLSAGHPKPLEEFEYSDGDIGDLITQSMFDVDFEGILGPMSFDENGDPTRTVLLAQQQGIRSSYSAIVITIVVIVSSSSSSSS